MNVNNENQSVDMQNGYPHFTQPFPQSQQPYPQSQQSYPQSGTVYPMPEYEFEKKSKTWQIALIAVVAVLIVALATTLMVVLINRDKMQNNMLPPPMAYAQGVTLNGQPLTFDVIQEEGQTYLPIKEFAEEIGYDCAVDGEIIKIIAPNEIHTLKIGSTTVENKNQTTGNGSSVPITTAPFERDGVAYIYVRDLAMFLEGVNVRYDQMMDSVQINVGMVGGPGAPPPGGAGAPPPGGQMPPSNVGQQNTAVDQEAEKQADQQALPQAPKDGQGSKDAPPPKK